MRKNHSINSLSTSFDFQGCMTMTILWKDPPHGQISTPVLGPQNGGEKWGKSPGISGNLGWWNIPRILASRTYQREGWWNIIICNNVQRLCFKPPSTCLLVLRAAWLRLLMLWQPEIWIDKKSKRLLDLEFFQRNFLFHECSRWWFQILFYFHPYLGKIPSLTNIFQMGWNHKPALRWLSWTNNNESTLRPRLPVFFFSMFNGYLQATTGCFFAP